MIGHWRQLEKAGLTALPLQLPPLLLLEGPPGIGKTVVSYWLAVRAEAFGFDFLDTGRLTSSAAESIVDFARVRPLKKIKVATCELGSVQSWDRLLKLAEEPPAGFHLIVRAAHEAPGTLRSRAHVVRLEALSDDDLFQVLTEVIGWKPERAAAVLPLAAGTVDGAKAAEQALEQMGAVEVYLRAVATGDQELGEAALRSFREGDGIAAIRLVMHFCAEAVSNRWRVFKINEMAPEVQRFAADPSKVSRLFMSLYQPGRPRIVARAALSRWGK